ncbi:MAG: type III PLP-dependent enzyme [Candidatus Wallbacteria bacterium]|nr:type III PLP-dependent enzyme [Candidatus Wallbacteria bacterium]
MKLTAKIRRLAQTLPTPFLIMDLKVVEKKYRALAEAFPNSQIFYAIKANAHPRIITLLNRLGCCFDAASRNEIEKLLSLGVAPEKISFGNTIKRDSDIRAAFELGVRYFVADATLEVEKIAECAPKSKVFIRLEMDSGDSDWPLSHKFGTSKEDAVKLLKLAKKLGLTPFGLSFHVGSQCYNPKRWPVALEKCHFVFTELAQKGIELSMINLGGGFPIQHLKSIPSLSEISDEVNHFLGKYFETKPAVFLEPGRYMVGDAGIMVGSVITKREGSGENWLFIDAGVFHGLMETIENFRYEVKTDLDQSEHLAEFHLAGPTCDSIDVIYDTILLPLPLSQHDKLYFLNTGAYTVEYNTNFNGFPPPKIYFLDELD